MKRLSAHSARSTEAEKDQYLEDRVAIVRKSEAVQIKISRGIYKGVEIVDIRTWCRQKRTGIFVPTRKGITVEVGLRDELIKALNLMSGFSE